MILDVSRPSLMLALVGVAPLVSRGIAKVRLGARVAASWTASKGTNVSTIWLVARHWVKTDRVFSLRGFGRWGLGVNPFIWTPLGAYYSRIDGRKVKREVSYTRVLRHGRRRGGGRRVVAQPRGERACGGNSRLT